MAYCGILCRVALVRTDVSGELSGSIFKVTRIGEQRATLAVKIDRRKQHIRLTLLLVHLSCHLDDGGAKFQRNVGSYKSHTAKYPRRRHSFEPIG
jgi:hypothetical protein